MKYDQYGRSYTDSKELCDLLYNNPELDLSLFLVEDPQEFNKSRADLHADLPHLKGYVELAESVSWFDERFQAKWRMPDEYKDLDIAKWVLDQCADQNELQRAGQELMEYADRDLLPLLQYLKYLVDIMRKNSVIWGVGRGSSVASFVLYLIGVHRIHSLRQNLDFNEFMR